MSKIICSPGSYVQGNGEIRKLAKYCQEFGAKKAYLVVDKFIYDTYKDQIESSFEIEKMPYTAVVFGGECSDVEIKKHQDNLNGANVILGIGDALATYYEAAASVQSDAVTMAGGHATKAVD